MKSALKVLLYITLSAVSLVLIVGGCLVVWVRWQQHLPGEQTARQQFETHRTDYVRFVSLLRKDPGPKFVGNDGRSNPGTDKARVVPEYRDLMRKIGAKFVTVREDGSIEFALWGFGCAICSDDYMGVRYFPVDYDTQARPGWTPILVNSLESKNLPREKDSIADGLYVVQVEPEWFIYRLQINE